MLLLLAARFGPTVPVAYAAASVWPDGNISSGENV
jgi:hypothetical protein